VPGLQYFSFEEDPPWALFDLPLRSIGDLHQMVARNELARIHITGQVLYQIPGQYVVVRDGDASALVLSRDTEVLQPGDMIDAVGIVGRDGARAVLREGILRKAASGQTPVPSPLQLADLAMPSPALDMRLIRLRGKILDAAVRNSTFLLNVQSGASIFEAELPLPANGSPPSDLVPGAVAELTGLCRLSFDDTLAPRGFRLQIRGLDDVTVVEAARFWTVARALGVSGGLALCILLSVVWVRQLRRRVQAQTLQLREQMAKEAGLEAELAKAQRLRSLGILANGIAHDFNNILTGILGNVTLAMLDERMMERFGDGLRDIETSAKRARELTLQLVTFAKGGDPVRVAMDTLELMQGAVHYAFGSSQVRVETRFPQELWPVSADRAQVGRVLHNLLVFARGRSSAGEVVHVDVSNEIIGREGGPLERGRYVCIVVSDSGAPLAKQALDGFFDPYQANQTGEDRFGMAIAYSIVKRHGGDLQVESGRGTTLRLWLPAAEKLPPPPPLTQPAGHEVKQDSVEGTRVLLMDDEETIRRLGDRYLQKLGCSCTTVADGESCLEAYRKVMDTPDRFHVVILDLTIPGGMGGRECIEALLRIDPKVRAIVSSGYADDPVMANYRRHGFRAVVPKPYAVENIGRVIAKVLNAPN
jgi:signal transduction histidine kinase/ActR/RegA family two-component response regulator